MFSVTVRNGSRYYRATLTRRQYMRHDNGAMISCGLTVGEHGFRESTLARWIKQRVAREVSHDEWNHSGCQSSCKLRGDSLCRW